MPNMVTQGVSNYLVPATSSPNAYLIRGTFSAAPEIINFSNISLNGLAFRPSGVIIDNTAGTGPLNILIPEMSFNIVCPAGTSMNMPYPAPMNHTAAITGLGDATVIFVDYPLQPYSSVQASGAVIPNPLPVTATAPLNVNISTPNPLPVSTNGLTDTELRATPVPVSTNGLTDTELRATPVPVSVPNPLPISFPAGIQEPVINVTTNTAGATQAGKVEVIFLVNVGPVSIFGNTGFPTGYTISLRASSGNTLAAIPFDATGGSLNITTIG